MKRTLAALIATLAIFGFAAGSNAQTTTQQPQPPMGQPPSGQPPSGQRSMGQPPTNQPSTGMSQSSRHGETQGAKSEYRQAQQLLKQEGYYSGPVDGVWGRQSRAAVTKYQQDKGIRASGTLDAATMASLGMRR